MHILAAVAGLAVPLVSDSASAQSLDTAAIAAPHALLPRDHWSIAAANRLAAARLTPAGFDPGSGVNTVGRMHGVLAAAAGKAAGAPMHSVAENLLQRFDEEFRADDSRQLDIRGVLTGTLHDGRLEPGGLDAAGAWAGPRGPEHNDRSVGAGAQILAGTGAIFVSASPFLTTDGMRADQAIAGVRWRRLGAFAGRYTPGYRTTMSGSIVLQATAPFNGAGVFLEPGHLPGFLRHIGPVGAETFLAPAHDAPGVYNPWFWTARLSLEPASWIAGHITRAAYLGSLSPGSPVTPRDIALLFIGQNGVNYQRGDYFDDQVVAVDGWIRPPLSVPLMFYVDWGAEDSHGGWWYEPGQVFGLRLAAIPGAEEASVGVERTRFPHTCCTVGDWYKHYQKKDGWVENGVPLGHPLGGHGWETRLYATADLSDARVLVTAEVFTAHRGDQNIYAPRRMGGSRGGEASVRARLARRFDLSANASFERGSGWVESDFKIILFRQF